MTTTRRHPWFVKQWLERWQQMSTSSRWMNGRTIWRQKRILSFHVGEEGWEFKIRGTELYSVRIQALPLESAWIEETRNAFTRDLRLLLKVYQGSLTKEDTDGFPSALGFRVPELKMSCTCQDSVIPCKHLCAAALDMAERFTEDYTRFLAFGSIPWQQVLSRVGRDEEGSTAEQTANASVYGMIPKPRSAEDEERMHRKRAAPPFWASPFPYQQIMDEIDTKLMEEDT